MNKSQRVAFDINKVNIGTKVVTRAGHSGKIFSINLEKLDYPISAIIDLDGKENTLIFTKEGHFYSDDKDSMFDLFLEEEKIENQKPIQPEKQDKHEVNCLQSKDNISNGAIVFEDFNGDDGFYKVHLDYLNKEQVEVIETLVEDWNEEKKELNQINKIKSKFKVGDILINGSNIFILHFIHDKIIVPYCHVNINDGKFYNDFRKHFCICSIDDVITLATKEQCNFFIQKMKEAGYRLDIKNKELKKIDKEDKRLNQINKEVKTRFMTNQELSWWLKEHPEEHREMTFSDKDNYIASYYSYFKNKVDETVNSNTLIRKNGGEWQKPLIEI